MSEITVSGVDGKSVLRSLQNIMLDTKPSSVGMASAFLTLEGARKYHELTKKAKSKVSQVIAGISGGITQPAAIKYLIDNGHIVRLGVHNVGIFHPKLLVGGDKFTKNGLLKACSCAYIGSANFTNSGLTKNIEIALATSDIALTAELAGSFATVWKNTKKLTPTALESYEKTFVKIQRRRSLEDLHFLEITDDIKSKKKKAAPPLIPQKFCKSVWAGLQSFTGEHRFQVEFPKKAGVALSAMFGTSHGNIPIECSDGLTRDMIFNYYKSNGMHRLNVPNDMPLAEWARTQKKGILLIWQDSDSGTGHFHAEIFRGQRQYEVIGRSKALGTFGKTSTREYGWY